MAAGDNMAITNNTVSAFGTVGTVTKMSADADTADLAQKFIYTPTGKDNKVVFLADVAATNGTVVLSLKAGAGVFGTPAKTINAVQAKTSFFQIETGCYIQSDGTIEITATPASGKKLKTDHAFAIYVVELQ